MGFDYLRRVREAIEQVNPNEVRALAERAVRIRIVAESAQVADGIADYLCRGLSDQKHREARRRIWFAGDAQEPAATDIEIYEQGLPHSDGAFLFSFHDPDAVVRQILERRSELGVPLARQFPPFRGPVCERIIFSVAKENAYFSITTALPGVLPNLPWALAEATSDTAFLTVNQVRMAFLLAAASDRVAGYSAQKAEIASIIAAAFGWRSLARELISKIPFGGGVIPKAAIAFAGTYVAGLSLERLYRVGYALSRSERRAAYEEALERGKNLAVSLWNSRKRPR